ncbi:MAG: 3-phosphoshikimate 1-carboxyvinyltransferase [Thermoplasmata archaeon]|nr:MAG: 3-phosphoshikimate 1-carboxyvinyltransferase [Thermoplasmata archaeon]
MHMTVIPSKLSGVVSAPPSKSLTHRAFILGMLADGTTTIKSPLISDDTISTMKAVEAFGAKIDKNEDGYIIHPNNLSIPDKEIDVGNSGTTLRLMCGIASLLDGTTTFSGDESISKRPIAPLLKALNQLGASCKSVGKNGSPPVVVRGVINKEHTEIRGDICSQFISSLLISCPLKSTDTTIELNSRLVSPSYVALTMDMLDKFNVKVETNDDNDKFFIKKNQIYKGIQHKIPGDYSSASYIMVGAAITGSEVTINNLDPHSIQGDRAILDILQEAGAEVNINGSSTTIKGGNLQGVEVDCSDIPDLFPILAVLGAYSKGKTRLYKATHVKYKESNRLETTANMIRSLGAEIDISEEGIMISGGRVLEGGIINPEGDHRIFMAGVIAALAASKPSRVIGPLCHGISYPDFIKDIKSLGANVEEGQ